MLKKILTVAVAIMLLCQIMSGCKNKQETSVSTETTEQIMETTTAEETTESFIVLPDPGEPEWIVSEQVAEGTEPTEDNQSAEKETTESEAETAITEETQIQQGSDGVIQRDSNVGTAGETDWG